jgi:hypothetical protein
MKVSNIFWVLLASAYGVSPYNTGKYGAGDIQVGPITLPVTGPQGLAILGIAIIAIGVGLFVWSRQLRRQG